MVTFEQLAQLECYFQHAVHCQTRCCSLALIWVVTTSPPDRLVCSVGVVILQEVDADDSSCTVYHLTPQHMFWAQWECSWQLQSCCVLLLFASALPAIHAVEIVICSFYQRTLFAFVSFWKVMLWLSQCPLTLTSASACWWACWYVLPWTLVSVPANPLSYLEECCECSASSETSLFHPS